MRHIVRSFLPLVLLAAWLPAQVPTNAGVRGFYREPAIHGQTLVFAAEGDLWAVPVTGGLAHRLTSHASEETDPVISPDGTTLAFTARYEGPAELYTMPLSGGSPVRQTWEGEASIATTWTRDSKLVYTTTHYSTLPNPEMVQLDLANTHPHHHPALRRDRRQLRRHRAHALLLASGLSQQCHQALHRRHGAADLEVHRRRDSEAVQLTVGYRGESHSPMWWNGRVYFVTDRDGTMNLWSMDESGQDLRQLTHHSGWDVREPDLDAGRIVYQLGADLWLYDVASGQSTLIPIAIASDLDQLRDRWVADPTASITSAHISPNGDRVVLTTRGRVFVAPAKQGRLVQATRKDSVRYRDAIFLPDGKSVLALSDETGELEFMKLPANGVGSDSALTRNGSILRFGGTPSPDGKWIAYADNNRDLWVLNTATGTQRKISENREGIGDLAWSPDSKWLAYTMTALNTFQQIKLFGVDAQNTVTLTTDRVNSFAPAWDPKGEFLYFLSDRNLHTTVGSPWGSRQPEPYFDRSMELYQVALHTGLRSPFLPNDELHPAAAVPAVKPKADSAASVAVRIDSARVDDAPPQGSHPRRATIPPSQPTATGCSGSRVGQRQHRR